MPEFEWQMRHSGRESVLDEIVDDDDEWPVSSFSEVYVRFNSITNLYLTNCFTINSDTSLYTIWRQGQRLIIVIITAHVRQIIFNYTFVSVGTDYWKMLNFDESESVWTKTGRIMELWRQVEEVLYNYKRNCVTHHPECQLQQNPNCRPNLTVVLSCWL